MSTARGTLLATHGTAHQGVEGYLEEERDKKGGKPLAGALGVARGEKVLSTTEGGLTRAAVPEGQPQGSTVYGSVDRQSEGRGDRAHHSHRTRTVG